MMKLLRHPGWHKSFKQWSRALSAMVAIAVLLFSGTAWADITLDDLIETINGNPNYSQAEASGACVAPPASTGGGGPISTTESQAAIAKTVMGVVKSEGFAAGDDKKAAQISLMVAIAESGLKIYSNSNIPLSLGVPTAQAVGHDHYSLGVFQQQITTGWSTLGGDINNIAAINQLMDPAYNAEAFLGSKPGSNAPRALSKGLQNIGNWQGLDPWVAAQKVQVSGTSDGSNYKRFQAAAQSLIDQYWDSSPAVPLPVPLTGGPGGGSGGGSSGGGTSSSAGCFAGGFTGGTGGGNAIAQAAIALAIGGNGNNATAAFVTAMANYKSLGGESPPFGGKDCGFFVATAIRNSGVMQVRVSSGSSGPGYPAYGTYDMLPYMQQHTEQFAAIPNLGNTSNLEPGDIFIIRTPDSGHTFLYLGNQPGGYNMASASQASTFPHMSHIYFTDRRGTYSIFRFIHA